MVQPAPPSCTVLEPLLPHAAPGGRPSSGTLVLHTWSLFPWVHTCSWSRREEPSYGGTLRGPGTGAFLVITLGLPVACDYSVWFLWLWLPLFSLLHVYGLAPVKKFAFELFLVFPPIGVFSVFFLLAPIKAFRSRECCLGPPAHRNITIWFC